MSVLLQGLVHIRGRQETGVVQIQDNFVGPLDSILTP